MPKLPESFRDLNKMHMIFALVSIVLLVSLVSLFMKDYSREWKHHQTQFRQMEVEKARMKYDVNLSKLESDPQYQALLREVQTAQKGVKEQCVDLQKIKSELKKLEDQNTITSQKLKFIKAKLDAAKYHLEEAKAHQWPDLAQASKSFENLSRQNDEVSLVVDVLTQKTNERNQVVAKCESSVTELERKKRVFTSQVAILQRKLKKIDPNEWSLTNRIADIIRDLPVIDMANPNLKVRQIVLKDINDDVNFALVPKVDRCTSCHLGISNPDYVNAGQPYKTHPNLELFLGNDSPHPIEEFGCTSCHGGRGRATDFAGAVHTPANEKQKEEWIEKYGWHEFHHWDNPMLPSEHIEAGCFKCHSGQTVIKGAEKLNLGLNLIERAGCYNCHTIAKYQGWPKSGPGLLFIDSKLSKEWTYQWIDNPKQFRPDTWMPSFFHLSNNSDPESTKRGEQEIHAIVAYLFANSAEFKIEDMPAAGNIQKGEELASSLGCFACHQVIANPKDQKRTMDSLKREHGPNLMGQGNKTYDKWIYNWVRDPKRYHPESRMPNLRLNDQEAADVAAYLSVDKSASFKSKIPVIDEQIINNIVLGFLMKLDTKKAAEQKLSAMKLDQKLVFAGESLIGQYGCYSCHDIKGFENIKPIGTELTEEGNKPINKLDFGFVHIEHSQRGWFEQKLKDPRIFDNGKIRTPDEKLKMPNFYLNQEEVSAITTAIMGFVKDNAVAKKKTARTPKNLYVEEGQKLIRQLNCQGCHIMEGTGGSIQNTVKDWLIQYEKQSPEEAAKIFENSSPPNLHGLGKKAKSEWLFEFLHNPSTTTVRPWIKTRMPTYELNDAHLNVLIRYFNALDKQDSVFAVKVDTSMSTDEYKIAEDLFVKLDCLKCHVVGNQLPTGTKDTWAPDLMVAKQKLKPNWIIEWIQGPQKLLPGTKMPAFLDTPEAGPEDILNGDESGQIRLLRNYLYNIMGPPQVQATEPPKTLEDKATPKEELKTPAQEPQPPAPPEAGPAASTAPADAQIPKK